MKTMCNTFYQFKRWNQLRFVDIDSDCICDKRKSDSYEMIRRVNKNIGVIHLLGPFSRYLSVQKFYGNSLRKNGICEHISHVLIRQ